jgi:hypothetical protein
VPITRRAFCRFASGPALLAGCSSPPVLLYHLNADDRRRDAAGADARNLAAGAGRRLPEYLDREAILVLRASSLLALSGQLAELARRRCACCARIGGSLAPPVVGAPVPAGVVVTRQLRVELLAFDIEPGVAQCACRRWGPGRSRSVAARRRGDSATLRGQQRQRHRRAVVAHRLALATGLPHRRRPLGSRCCRLRLFTQLYVERSTAGAAGALNRHRRALRPHLEIP